jgi:Rod binding domain-containing protein
MSLSISCAATHAPATQSPGKLKAEKAAQDFESVLLASVLESLQKTFAGTSQDSPVGSDNYAAMGTQALATTMSSHGGIGIARMILQQWQQSKVPELSNTEVRP